MHVTCTAVACRSVADEQRTLALGMQSVAFRAFGSIPGPIVFGAIFDSTCIYWQYECSRRGNCWVYNNQHLSQRAVTLALIGIAINFTFSLLSWLFYPKKTVMEISSKKTLSDLSVAAAESKPVESPVESLVPRRPPTDRLDSHCSGDILLESEI